eukprot:353638-Chlamydomonas_euryale.AAC.5
MATTARRRLGLLRTSSAWAAACYEQLRAQLNEKMNRLRIFGRTGWKCCDAIGLAKWIATCTSSGGVDGAVCQSFALHKTIHPPARRTRPPSWPYLTKLCALCFVHG